MVSFLQTRPNPQSPMLAMMRIATEGPVCPDRMPIISTPIGPVPIHMVTIPITRDRVASGASVRIKVVCMFEKAKSEADLATPSGRSSRMNGGYTAKTVLHESPMGLIRQSKYLFRLKEAPDRVESERD